jgi:hypothetical protein
MAGPNLGPIVTEFTASLAKLTDLLLGYFAGYLLYSSLFLYLITVLLVNPLYLLFV